MNFITFLAERRIIKQRRQFRKVIQRFIFNIIIHFHGMISNKEDGW